MNKHINWKYILLLIVSFFVLGYVVFTQRYSDVQINKYEDIEVVKENKAINGQAIDFLKLAVSSHSL